MSSPSQSQSQSQSQSPSPVSPPMRPLHYPALRLQGCRAALWAWLRRWALYGVVAAALIGVGSNSPVASVGAVAAWLVLPLLQAAADPVRCLGMALGQSMAGGLLVWAMRGLLWPQRWAAVERALPIPPAAFLRSDATVAALGLLPLLAAYALGAGVWLTVRPAWLMPWLGTALAGLALLMMGTWAAGLAVLQGLRRAARARAASAARASAALHDADGAFVGRRIGRRVGHLVGQLVGRPVGNSVGRFAGSLASRLAGRDADADADAPGAATRIRPRRSAGLLWALPLWRGPARRTGLGLLLGMLGLPAWAAAGPWLGPDSALPTGQWMGGWLAGFGLLSLLVTSAVNHLSRTEFAPLARAIRTLPLSPQRWQYQRAVLASLPGLLGLLCLMVALPWAQVRPVVALAFAALCAGAQVWELWATAADPAAKASRWLLALALLVALATEVAR